MNCFAKYNITAKNEHCKTCVSTVNLKIITKYIQPKIMFKMTGKISFKKKQ